MTTGAGPVLQPGAELEEGLENSSLLAPCAVAIAAVLVRAVVAGRLLTTGPAVWCGLLAAGAALTRPDGLIYASRSRWRRWCCCAAGRSRRRCGRSSSARWPFAVPAGAYLARRLATFGEWLPNTALAKSQGLPWVAALARPGEIVGYLGRLGVLLAAVLIGAAATRHPAGNSSRHARYASGPNTAVPTTCTARSASAVDTPVSARPPRPAATAHTARTTRPASTNRRSSAAADLPDPVERVDPDRSAQLDRQHGHPERGADLRDRRRNPPGAGMATTGAGSGNRPWWSRSTAPMTVIDCTISASAPGAARPAADGGR